MYSELCHISFERLSCSFRNCGEVIFVLSKFAIDTYLYFTLYFSSKLLFVLAQGEFRESRLFHLKDRVREQ